MANLKNSNAESLYIHIPFCIRKCNYCAFISYTNIKEFENKYINALIKEISDFNCKNNIKTIYLGGGTPNLLSINSLEKIFCELNKSFNIDNNCEISMEFNPKLSDINYIKTVKNLGVNRISLGVQSFNNNILKTLNRIHNTEDVLKTIDSIKNADITNFSIDIIYGIFNQTLSDIERDLEIIKDISPNHISTYGLKIEKGTPFEKFDKTNLPDEDLCADMYLKICEILENDNYNHYEISNFAKKGFESKHNQTYWKNKEYFGFGVSAHGFLNNIRYKNTNELSEYIANPLNKEIINVNKKEDNIEEEIFLNLRLRDGVDLIKLKNNFNIDLLKLKNDKIQNFIDSGHAKIEKNHLFLTNNGFLISNYIISELLV